MELPHSIPTHTHCHPQFSDHSPDENLGNEAKQRTTARRSETHMDNTLAAKATHTNLFNADTTFSLSPLLPPSTSKASRHQRKQSTHKIPIRHNTHFIKFKTQTSHPQTWQLKKNKLFQTMQQKTSHPTLPSPDTTQPPLSS